MSEDKWVKVGVVGVDSATLMICDPAYIDSEWEEEDHVGDTEVNTVTFPDGKTEVVPRCSPRWFELVERINSGELKIESKYDEPREKLSRWAVTHKMLTMLMNGKEMTEGFGQFDYKAGHAGVAVAFPSGYGDGCYDVFARIIEDPEWGTRIAEVRIVMIDETSEEG